MNYSTPVCPTPSPYTYLHRRMLPSIAILMLLGYLTNTGRLSSVHAAIPRFTPSVTATSTFTVTSTLDAVDANPSDGVCATTAGQCTLRAAIQQANALTGADTISIPAGTYTLTIPRTTESDPASGDLNITQDVTLNGGGAATTIIDGGQQDRVLTVAQGSTVTIAGVTVRNGDSYARYGAGIWNGGTLTLTGSTVRENSAVQGGGGGIMNRGTLTLNNSTISNNRAFVGGGIVNDIGRTLVLTNSIVSDNTGGGLLNDNSGTV